MNDQKGIVHLLFLIIVLLLIVLAVGFALVSLGVIKNPFPNLPFVGQIGSSQPSIQPKTQYQNPFDKNTQYVNPFEKYKNPFTINK